jgi:hypothetical protein
LKNFAILIIFNVLLLPCYGSNEVKELRSDHFIISSDKDVDGLYVDRIKDLAEEYYKTITQEFNLIRDKLWLWDNRAKIFIAKDREDYVRKYNCPDWSDGCVNYAQKVIYTYPNQQRFNAILSHELTHILFREYVGAARLPLWLEEGVAAYIENKYGGFRYQLTSSFLKKAIIEKKYIPLPQLNYMSNISLRNQPTDYINLFYAESYSLVDFLIKKGSRDNFYNFLYFLRNGSDINNALSRSFSSIKNMEDLEKQWIKSYQE